MEYFRRMELVSDVPPHLQHFLRQPYPSLGNPWDTGDSSLMNSDLTVALNWLFLLMAGYPPSEAQRVRLRREGFPGTFPVVHTFLVVNHLLVVDVR